MTTVDGLDADVRERLVQAFLDAGASQCGFCTPGILVRLAALGPDPHPNRIPTALLAHLCRCTGWNTILDAASGTSRPAGRDLLAASRRASIEGGVPQQVGPSVILGKAEFAADVAPEPDWLTAVPDGEGGWAIGESLAEARAQVHPIPGRRSGQLINHPVRVPEGEWALTLQTTWVEPAYLEPDVSWCRPGQEPASPVANGGAFGAKTDSVAPQVAADLARRHGRPVRVVLSREDVVRLGPKRPPIGAGLRADGTGILRVVRTPGIAAAVASVAPGLVVEEVDVPGPATSAAIRGAGWVEAAVLLAALDPQRGAEGSATAMVRSPWGAQASATVELDAEGAPQAVDIEVSCGTVLDEIVLRSYTIGAAHMALGWVCSEAIAVDAQGQPVDLTIRSFGVLRARDMPPVAVSLHPSDERPINGSDAVFAAVAAATWVAQGRGPSWPIRRGSPR